MKPIENRLFLKLRPELALFLRSISPPNQPFAKLKLYSQIRKLFYEFYFKFLISAESTTYVTIFFSKRFRESNFTKFYFFKQFPTNRTLQNVSRTFCRTISAPKSFRKPSLFKIPAPNSIPTNPTFPPRKSPKIHNSLIESQFNIMYI
jgi:hypothetical protein